MKRALAALGLLFVFSPEAGAVLPSLIGPLQALVALLPQLAVVAIAAVGAAMGIRHRPHVVSWIVARVAAHRRAAVVTVAVVLGGIVAATAVVSLWPRAGASPQARNALVEFPGSWPTFRGDAQRSGAPLATGDGVSRGVNPQVLWTYVDESLALGDFSSSPALANARVYIGSAQASVFSSFGGVYCLDATDGGEIWTFRTRHEVFSSPAVAEGRVFIGEGLHRHVDSSLYCLDANSGDLIWEFPTTSHVESSPTVIDGKVVFGAGADGVYCLSTKTGDLIWRFEGIHVDSSPAVYDGTVIVGAGYEGKGVYLLDLETGDATGDSVWEHPTAYPVWGSPSISGVRAYFGVGNGNFVQSAAEPYGAVLCLDIRTRRELWTREVQDSVLTAPAVGDGRVYFGSRDGGLYCLKARDGEPVWRHDAGSPVLSSPAVVGDVVYGASEAGDVFALDADTGSLRWSLPLGDADSKILSSPAVAAGRLVLGTTGGLVYCLGDTISE